MSEIVTRTDKRPKIEITLFVNGRQYDMEIEPRETLLDVLRKRLDLTGAKKSCDMEVCGACTVLVDGQAVSACTYLAYEARDKHVLTIEGLADGDKLHPIQEAYIECGGFQCGFCTPGMILATKTLLEEIPNPTEEQIKQYMRGNICRCTGYVMIIDSIKAAAKKLSE